MTKRHTYNQQNSVNFYQYLLINTLYKLRFLMDLAWLGLIIPLSYFIISLFFFCFPTILHKKYTYKSSALNHLVLSDQLFCIGHRGGAFEGPENTIQLFKKTQKTSHMFELDVCFTKDRKLLVHHDSNLSRTTGRKVEICDIESKQIPPFLPTYQSFGGDEIKTQNNKIPLLSQLFQTYPDSLMNIDLKTPSQESIQEFNRLIRVNHRQDITVWGAAKDSWNQKLRQSNPEVLNFYSGWQVFIIFILFIFGLLPFACIRQGVMDIPLINDRFTQLIYRVAGGGCKSCLACFLLLILRFFNFMSKLFIPHLKKRGILTFYFILNEDQDFQNAVSTGCSGIMTDDTSKLSRFLKNKNLYFQQPSDSF